jgi:hypothetical protein
VYAGSLRFAVFDRDATAVPGEVLAHRRPGHRDRAVRRRRPCQRDRFSPDGRTLYHSDTRGHGDRPLAARRRNAERTAHDRHVGVRRPTAWPSTTTAACGSRCSSTGSVGSHPKVSSIGASRSRRRSRRVCASTERSLRRHREPTGDPALRGCLLRTQVDATGAPVFPARV